MNTQTKPVIYKPELATLSNVVKNVANNKTNTKELPNQSVSCLNCPKAAWQETDLALQCYCKMNFMYIWTKNEPSNIRACDEVMLAPKKAVSV